MNRQNEQTSNDHIVENVRTNQMNQVKTIDKKLDQNSEQQQQQQSRQENPDNTVVITNDKNMIKSNDQSIDKVFDSNNHPVQIQSQNNADDSSYKRIEEDEKSIDENDKLKIEMLGAKPDEQNSIIHMDLDSFADGKINDMIEAKDNQNNNKKDNSAKESLDDLLNKDVIKQIMDHNLHVKKKFSQLIIPDNINLEPSSWTTETRGNKYQALKNYIIGNGQFDYSRTITLTTQGGPGFLHHAEQLCLRWDGPISLAVYAPGEDFQLSVNMIYYLRQCANECIAKHVFWHLVYDIAFPPSAKISGPNSFLKTNKFDCTKSLDETMKILKIDNIDFRSNKSLPYPINILRNVARSSSKSKYLLASDIELYPNIGIIPAFFDLIEREQKGLLPVINVKSPHVYVLPIFEVKATKQPPKTKQELSKLFKSSTFFVDFFVHFGKFDLFVLQKKQRMLYSFIDMFVMNAKIFPIEIFGSTIYQRIIR